MSRTTRILEGHQYSVTHSVGHGQTGIRLDRFLMDHYPYRSREQLKRAIDSGAITIVRQETSKHRTVGKLKPSTALHPGDFVHLLYIRKPEPDVNFDFQKIYEDEEILVINKPAHLPVHPAGRYFYNTLITHLRTNGFTEVASPNNNFFLPHRIDRETSGVLVIAKTKAACAHLVRQFSSRQTEKYYLAIVRGNPTHDQFSVQDAIGKKKGGMIGLKMYSIPESEGGQPSHTDFTVIETRRRNEELFSLVACFPKTGRQHQIRAHAEIAGYPLVGDKIYGLPEKLVFDWLKYHKGDLKRAAEEEKEEDSAEENFEDEIVLTEEEQKMLILPRHALHAAGLKFIHPGTGKTMTIQAPLPKDLGEFFNSLPLFANRSQFSF